MLSQFQSVEHAWDYCNRILNKSQYDLFILRYVHDIMNVYDSLRVNEPILSIRSLHSYTQEYKTLSRDFVHQLVENVYNEDNVNSFKFVRQSEDDPSGFDHDDEDLERETRDILSYLRNNTQFVDHMYDVAHDFVIFGIGFSLRTRLGKDKYRYDRILPYNITFHIGIDGTEDIFFVRSAKLRTTNKQNLFAKTEMEFGINYDDIIQVFEKENISISNNKVQNTWIYKEFHKVIRNTESEWVERTTLSKKYDYCPIRVIRTPIANISSLPLGYAFHAYPLLIRSNELVNLMSNLIEKSKNPTLLKDQNLVFDLEDSNVSEYSTVLNHNIISIQNTTQQPLGGQLEVLETNVGATYQVANAFLQLLESKLAKMFDTRRFLDQKSNVEMTATEVNTRNMQDTQLLDPFILKLRKHLLSAELMTLLRERNNVEDIDEVMILYNTAFLERERTIRLQNKQTTLNLVSNLVQVAGLLKQSGIDMNVQGWIKDIIEDTEVPMINNTDNSNIFNIPSKIMKKVNKAKVNYDANQQDETTGIY